MSNKLSLFFSFLIAFNLLSAQVYQNGNVGVDNFPTINVKFSDRDPDLISISDLKVIDYTNFDETVLEIDEFKHIEDTLDYESENKSVLILYENLIHEDRIEQRKTFKRAIINSLPDMVKSGDNFNICFFALKEQDTQVLIPVLDSFTDDVDLLINSFASFNVDLNPFNRKNVSDIYSAVIEGVDLLNDLDSELPKTIFLLSEERQNIESTQKNSTNAINHAKKNNVVINSIKYNRKSYFQHADPTLATQTYGKFVVLTESSGDKTFANNSKVIESEKFLSETSSEIVKRSKGNNYEITFSVTDTISDGSNRTLNIFFDEQNIPLKISFNAPGNWLVSKFQIQPLLFSLVVFMLLIIICFLAYLFISKRKKAIEERLTKQKDLENKYHNTQNLVDKMRREEEERIAREKNLHEKKVQEQNNKRLLEEMSTLSNLPVLRFKNENGENHEFQIIKPIIKVGRDNTMNDLSINNNFISKSHFIITFLDKKFTISDNNSTNGLLLNGIKINESVLKNNDVIQIGDFYITFIF